MRQGLKSNGGQALEIGRRYCDLAAEARVLANIFQFGSLLRLRMQQDLDPLPVGKRPIVVFIGPNRRLLDDKRFTIRIKLVGHWLGARDWGLGAGDCPRGADRLVLAAAFAREGRSVRLNGLCFSSVYWQVSHVEVA